MSMVEIVAVSWWMILPLIVVGSLLHFLYDWTGEKRWAAVLGAVNESYWEHIKIAAYKSVSPRMHLLNRAAKHGRIYIGYIGRHLDNSHTN